MPKAFSGFITDYFYDEEYLELSDYPKSFLNVMLEQAWSVEVCSLGFLFVFFSMLKAF